jgi:hypothetical protein
MHGRTLSRRPLHLFVASSPRRLVCLVAIAGPIFLVLFANGNALGADASNAEAGPPIELGTPPLPTSAPSVACSVRHPICIHAPETSSLLAARALASADGAWEILTGALALPPPDTDVDGGWHVYLVDNVAGGVGGVRSLGGGDALLGERDPRTRFDSGISFGIVDSATPAGCQLDLALARSLARASLWRAAPATDEGSARAETEALARLAVPCAEDDADAAEFQSHPERAVVDASSYAFARGASRFFDWLDARFARSPVALLRGLWALAPTRTPASAGRWSSTPTGFDVLRTSLRGALFADSSLDDVFVRFAVERAGATPPIPRTPGVRVGWHVPWPQAARRLASPLPVAPTGAAYVLVDHGGAPSGAKLRIEAQWEDYGRMRWVVVKLDATGHTISELAVTSLDRGTRASLTVESLEAVDRVLIVGANVGNTERPFNPDQGEWEPHGWLLTLDTE